MRAALADLQTWTSNAQLTAAASFDGVSTDSRQLAPGNLFIALRGERFDAHDFLPQAAAAGIAAVVAERVPDGFTLPALIVPDTRIALAEIATAWRRKFQLPVIGVAGSNGKTTVKEMIAAILQAAFGAADCLATRGNLNNEVGVPLTVLRLDATCKAAVIELGMNHPGEIEALTAIAQPTVGLVNNAQREHQEFMLSVDAVAYENAAVLFGLPANGVAVFPADDVYTELWRDQASLGAQRRVLTFGLGVSADVRASYAPTAFGSDLLVTIAGSQHAIKLQAAGAHNVHNALAAIACTHAIGIEAEAIVRGLETFTPVKGRLQRKLRADGLTVIDDTYNANPDSVRAAIDVLAQAAAPRVLVLGDMGEVGADGIAFHHEVGDYARAAGIENLFTLGDLAQAASAAFGAAATHYTQFEQLLPALQPVLSANTTLLVKGSRFMKMERVVDALLGQATTGAH